MGTRLLKFLLLIPFVISCGVAKNNGNEETQAAQWQPAAGSVVVEGIRSSRNFGDDRSVLVAGSPAIMTNTKCDKGVCNTHETSENLEAVVYQINRAMKQPKYTTTTRSGNCADEPSLIKVTAKDGQFLIREVRCENNVVHEKNLSNESGKQLVGWAFSLPR